MGFSQSKGWWLSLLVNTRTDRIEIFVEAVARIYDFVGESRKAEKSEL